jgi:hypothetical protein
LPRAGGVVVHRVLVDRPNRLPSTTVTAIYPSGDVWPENMLRFYLHFSAPMSRGAGVRHVQLLDESGQVVPDAILAAYADLWNEDATRLTVFFDPGRVKRGVGPNLALGRAIVEDRRYAIAVDSSWLDADGQPLAAPFRHEFTAGSPAYDGLLPDDWQLTVPPAGRRDSLAITFPAPLDRALLEGAIGVRTAGGESLPGQVRVEAGETRWLFTPADPWVPGAYAVVALTLLEDPVGNSIGRPFEALTTGMPVRTETEVVQLPFDVR